MLVSMLVRFFLFLPNTSLRVGYVLGVLAEGSDGEDSGGEGDRRLREGDKWPVWPP
jgi:hypothetical protein